MKVVAAREAPRNFQTMDILERTFKLMDVDNTGFITDDQLLIKMREKGARSETMYAGSVPGRGV